MYNNIATAAKIVVSFRWITRDWSNIGRPQPSFINTFCHNGRIKSGKKYQCHKNGRRQTDYFSLCLVKYTNLLDMIVTFCFRAQKHFCPNWMHRPFSTATFSCSLFRWATHTNTHDIPLFLYLYGVFLFVQLDDCMRSFSLQLIGAYQIPSVCFWQHSSRVDAIYLCNRDPFTCTHTHKSRKFFKLQFRKCFSRSQCNIGCELSWVVSFWFLNLLWWGSRTNWRI